ASSMATMSQDSVPDCLYQDSRSRCCSSVNSWSAKRRSPLGMSFIALAASRYAFMSALGALEAISARVELRPLLDLRAVDVGDGELVQLHREARRRGDALRERLARRDAIRCLEEEDQVVALLEAGLDEPAVERAAETLAAMRREDVHLGPACVRVLGLIGVPSDEAGPHDRAGRVARHERGTPLVRRRRADARLDRFERCRRIFRHALLVHRLEDLRRLGGFGLGRGSKVDLVDLVAVWCVHSDQPTGVEDRDYVGGYVRAAYAPLAGRRGR